MPTVDELFDTMSESSGELNDACFIDPSTRIINVPSMYKELGVVSDEKVNRIFFSCPKIVGDNVDLTKYNLYINYQNAAGELNAYLIDDVSIMEATQGNMISFSWLLSRHVTAAAGTVRYIVCAKKSDGESTTNEWNTKVATGIVIANDIEPVEEIEEQNIDVIEQILARIDVLENGSGGSSVSLGISSAETCDSIMIKTVDGTGKPTSWKTYNIDDAINKFNEHYGVVYNDELPYTNFSKDHREGHKVGNVVTVAEVDDTGVVEDFSSEELTVPTKVSELENDSGYLTEHQSLVDYAKKSEIPTIPTNVSELQNDENYVKDSELDRKFTDFADEKAVMFEADLPGSNFKGSNTKHEVGNVVIVSETTSNGERVANLDSKSLVIPTKISELENDENYTPISLGITDAVDSEGKSVRLKSVDGNGKPNSWELFDTYDDMREFIAKEGLPDYAKKSEIPTVPTKVSQFQNDSEYVSKNALNAFFLQSSIPSISSADPPTKGQILVVSEEAVEGESPAFLKGQTVAFDEYAKKSEVPTIPESLKNPNALTIKVGDTTTTYDGSEAKTVDVSTGESIPSYWLTHLQTKADKIHEVMEAAGRNKSAFLFYTDAHWDYGAKKAPMLLKYLYNNTPINKTIFGGDIVNSESADRDVMKYLWEWRKQVRELPNHHSVVGNHDDGATINNRFSTNYIYSFLLAAEENSNIVQGGDMYYYIDEPCEKTRYLYLDTAYMGINSSQTAFIKEALKTAPDNWHIVAISHIWYEPDYDQYNVRPIPIKGYGTGVENLVNLFDSYNARRDEFSSCTAKVEFCIGGHCHRDYTGSTTGGIPIILCETDSHHNRSGLTDTVGTTTESSVNAVIVNYSTEKINVIRIGRGENFEVPLHASVTPPASYTNLLPTAIDMNGNVYNNSGYKAGAYINNADGLTEVIGVQD